MITLLYRPTNIQLGVGVYIAHSLAMEYKSNVIILYITKLKAKICTMKGN